MCNVEGIVLVDIAVGVFGEAVEDMRLKRVGGFHYEGVEVEPPEPVSGVLAGGRCVGLKRGELTIPHLGTFSRSFE